MLAVAAGFFVSPLLAIPPGIAGIVCYVAGFRQLRAFADYRRSLGPPGNLWELVTARRVRARRTAPRSTDAP